MSGWKRSVRLGLVLAAAGSAVAGAAPAPAGAVIASIGLSQPLGARSAWQLVAVQGPPVEDPGGNEAPGVVTLCLRKGSAGPCDPELKEALRATSTGDVFATPHYLNEARVVHPPGSGGRPVLLVRTASLHAVDSDQLVLTQALAYERDADRFVRVYDHVTGTNNDQEVRYVETGPLAGDVISVEPTRNAPYGFWVSVDALVSGDAATALLRYRSATRYGDNNPLSVIDSEMPNIQQRLGVWRPGLKLPLPAGACRRPHLVRMELWCG